MLLQRSEGGVQRPQSEVVHKSVFASVGQLQVFNTARDKDKYNKRDMSKPIAIRGGGGGRTRRIQELQTQDNQEVEEAEEATPSPEAHALQSLNPPKAAVQESKSSRNGSKERGQEHMEIPLEDMSKKKSDAAEILSKEKSELPPHGSRSSSYSPRRGKVSPSSPRLRANAMSSMDRSRPETRGERRKRAGSHPSPRASRSSLSSTSDERDSRSNVSHTSFTVNPKSKDGSDFQTPSDKSNNTSQSNESSQMEKQLSQDGLHERRRKHSSGPKTLTPAHEPAVSLIITGDASPSAGIDSPKLMPPTEPGRIHALSDTSAISDSGASNSATTGAAAVGHLLPKSAHSDNKTENQESEQLKSSTESEQEQESHNTQTSNKPSPSSKISCSKDSITKPPFKMSKEPCATIGENQTGADLAFVDRSSPIIYRATEQLSKIADLATTYAIKQEDGSLELSPEAAAQNLDSNKQDYVKGQIVTQFEASRIVQTDKDDEPVEDKTEES